MPLDPKTAEALTQDAVERVRRRWGSYLPADLRSLQAKSVFMFHPNEASLRVPFKPVWDNLFKTALGSSETSDQVALPGGFVTNELDRLSRRIHVNIGGNEFDWVGFFAHEYVHLLSHEEFFPKFYGAASGNPDIVEGVTDFLALSCFNNYEDGLTLDALQRCPNCSLGIDPATGKEKWQYTRKNRSAYRPQYDRAKKWARKNTLNLARYVFQGKPMSITI